MSDPYRVLNVPRNADQATIKQAYRTLAKTLHPDRNPGSARAEQRFKEVTQAHQLLSDPVKRARFDRGEIDAEGRPRRTFPFRGFDFAGEEPSAAAAGSVFGKMFGSAFGRGPQGAAGGTTFEDLLRRGARGAGTRDPGSSRGADRRYRLEVDFLTAARGGTERLELDRGRAVDVELAAGTEDGQILRLKGQGQGRDGAAPGDALVAIAIRPHPMLTREGNDVHVELPISVPEAIAGAKVTVPTIDGPVRITVPAGANSGQTLRLKGKGIAPANGRRGDQYVRLSVVLPDPVDPELRQWASRHPYDPRAATPRP